MSQARAVRIRGDPKGHPGHPFAPDVASSPTQAADSREPICTRCRQLSNSYREKVWSGGALKKRRGASERGAYHPTHRTQRPTIVFRSTRLPKFTRLVVFENKRTGGCHAPGSIDPQICLSAPTKENVRHICIVSYIWNLLNTPPD